MGELPVASSDCHFAFDRLGHRPNSLATIVAKDIVPILVHLDVRPDVNQAGLADIASAVAEVLCTRHVPDRRKCRIDTKLVKLACHYRRTAAGNVPQARYRHL